ncbi:MAG: flagellar basal-body rod protein FlgF [Bacillota bacterium]
MLRGLYTAASGMNAGQLRTNIISNNLANVNTTGYKKDQVVNKSFSEMLMKRLPDNQTIGTAGAGVEVAETATDLSAGGLRNTENPLDWSINGEGFFAVQTGDGIRYTRSGNFTLNQAGQVVTQNGNFVLGENGPLQIADNGNLKVDNQNNLVVDGQIVDQIQVVTFNDNEGLVKEGDNLYRATAEAGEEFAAPSQVNQGYLEQSNVNVVSSMTNMIEATRYYEANQRIAKTYDESLNKTVNSVGRL